MNLHVTAVQRSPRRCVRVCRYSDKNLLPNPSFAPARKPIIDRLMWSIFFRTVLPATTHFQRCFCRLKDFRRIATRYDKLARNYFSALCFVATFAFWP
jgi:transposase